MILFIILLYVLPSPLAQGRGLKHLVTFATFERHLWSPLAQGRGLKHHSSGRRISTVRRPSRRGVD